MRYCDLCGERGRHHPDCILYEEPKMISEIDIRDWTFEDFQRIADGMPDTEKRVTFSQEGDDFVLRLDKFINNFGLRVVAECKAKYGIK